jgi:hypothetical protein
LKTPRSLKSSLEPVWSVVAVAFQSVFRVEMHQNDIFLFFKNHFLDQYIKTIQNIQKKFIFNKKAIWISWKHGLACVSKYSLKHIYHANRLYNKILIYPLFFLLPPLILISRIVFISPRTYHKHHTHQFIGQNHHCHRIISYLELGFSFEILLLIGIDILM